MTAKPTGLHAGVSISQGHLQSGDEKFLWPSESHVRWFCGKHASGLHKTQCWSSLQLYFIFNVAIEHSLTCIQNRVPLALLITGLEPRNKAIVYTTPQIKPGICQRDLRSCMLHAAVLSNSSIQTARITLPIAPSNISAGLTCAVVPL